LLQTGFALLTLTNNAARQRYDRPLERAFYVKRAYLQVAMRRKSFCCLLGGIIFLTSCQNHQTQPVITKNPVPPSYGNTTSPSPKPSPSKPSPTIEIPTAKASLVRSPYSQKEVNVEKYGPGQLVPDPVLGNLFYNPPRPQNAKSEISVGETLEVQSPFEDRKITVNGIPHGSKIEDQIAKKYFLVP
jgi:hypothetical protein